MHIKFESVTVQNFLSYGNSVTIFDYREGIHAVIGSVIPGNKRNGAGKSALLADAITFALYGKTIRKVKKNSIINRINRSACLVKTSFTIGSNHYLVVRGFKPDIFEVYVNHSDEAKQFDSKAHTQKWLDSKLNISYVSFTNLIVLNVNLSKPFLKMKADEKRLVLEDLVNLGIYAKMRDKAKTLHLNANASLKVLKTELKGAIDKYEVGQSRRESILKEAKKFESRKKSRIIELKHKIKGLESSLDDEIQKIIDETNESVEKLNANTAKSVKEIINKTDENIKNSEEILSQKINMIVSDIQNTKEQITGIDYKDEIIKFEEKLEKCEKSLEKLNTKISECKSVVQDKERTIKDNEVLVERIEGKSECPLCHTPTDNPVILETVKESKEKIKDAKALLAQTDKDLSGYLEKLEKGIEVKGKLNNRIRSLHSESNDQLKIHNNITSLEKEKKDYEVELANVASKEKEAEKEKVSNIEKITATKQTSLIKHKNDRIEELKKSTERSITDAKESIENEKQSSFDVDSVISEKDIEKLKEELDETKQNHNNADEDLVYNKYCRTLLSEDGIGKYVVKKVLPYMNKQVNAYLNMLGTEYTIKFNDDLEATLVARNGEESEYTSFSGGEKKRIDLSVMLALMDVAHSQNTVSTNILILDEVLDTSMDTEGVETFMIHMKETFKKLHPNKCIYVITHRKEINDEAFDSIVHVIKKNDFTMLEMA